MGIMVCGVKQIDYLAVAVLPKWDIELVTRKTNEQYVKDPV
jgi:hypothetical protein